MKVLHVISGGDTGGAKTSVHTLIESLNTQGVKTTLLCFMESVFTDEAKSKGFDVRIILQKNRFDLTVRGAIVDLIESENYDMINAHGARANFIMAATKKRIGIPVITTVHSDYEHDFDHDPIKRLIFTMLNRYSLKRMDAYITMADYFKRIMMDRGFDGDQIHVAYNGVLEMKPNLEDKVSFYNKTSITYEPDKTYVGIASRLHPIKGVDVFIKGAAKVLAHRDDVVFVIAGYGEEKYEKLYKELAVSLGGKEGIHFIGFVDHIQSFYEAIDINTNTSHSEAVCYALLEGGMLHKPTIASAVGGSVELIKEGINGLLFDDDDADGFAKAVESLVDDKAYSQKLAKVLHEDVEASFSTKAMGQHYIRIYNDIERTKSK